MVENAIVPRARSALQGRPRVFSDYIVFVDESGDHSLTSIDPQYPMFVLAFCIFPFVSYNERTAPGLLALKFKHFGNDCIVLHEHDLRMKKGPFSKMPEDERNAFYQGLRDIVEASDLTIIAAAINKERLSERYANPEHPYNLGVLFGLERLRMHLSGLGQGDRRTHVICEARGKNEDRDLELEFRRVCDRAIRFRETLPFEIAITNKLANSEGLQLADVVARPIGLQILRPEQPNRMWDSLRPKLRAGPGGRPDGYGLKVFP